MANSSRHGADREQVSADCEALVNPKMSMSTQKRHLYTGNFKLSNDWGQSKHVSTLRRCVKECQSTVATTLICRLDHQESSDCTLCYRHWEYDLKQLDILSVDASDDESSTVILAAIQVVFLSYSWYSAGTCSAVFGCA